MPKNKIYLTCSWCWFTVCGHLWGDRNISRHEGSMTLFSDVPSYLWPRLHHLVCWLTLFFAAVSTLPPSCFSCGIHRRVDNRPERINYTNRSLLLSGSKKGTIFFRWHWLRGRHYLSSVICLIRDGEPFPPAGKRCVLHLHFPPLLSDNSYIFVWLWNRDAKFPFAAFVQQLVLQCCPFWVSRLLPRAWEQQRLSVVHIISLPDTAGPWKRRAFTNYNPIWKQYLSKAVDNDLQFIIPCIL